MLTPSHQACDTFVLEPEPVPGGLTSIDQLNLATMEPVPNTVEANTSAVVSDANEDAPPTLAEPASGPVTEVTGSLPIQTTSDAAAAPSSETITGMLG